MEKFIWLIFAHYIGDIAFQSIWQAENKSKYWYVMLSHCIIWTCCISVALQYIGLFAMWKVIFLIIGHGVCDEIKTHQKIKSWWKIYPDQAWHLIQLIIVYYF